MLTVLQSNIAHSATPVEHLESPEQTDTINVENVVVTGKRASLATAQAIRRNKLEIVDAVVADEIHKLPDFNLSDALQRVSGIQIARDRGEGSVVAIRGLTQIETLLNGREIFTAWTGRNLDFADIPSEMVASIDVYKTSSAEHLEGGIGGLINLRTRRPFDFSGREIVLSGRVIEGDLVDDRKPQFSLLASDRWQTAGVGEFGALVNVVYQERAWREDQKTTGAPTARTDIIPGETVFAPNGTSETTSLGERERFAANLIFEWRPSDALELYFEASHAEFKTFQDSHQINVFASSTFETGSAALFPGTRDLQRITWTNADFSVLSFARDTIDRTSQLAVGGSWAGEAFTLKTDLSYTKSYNSLFFSGPFLAGTAAAFTHDLSGDVPATSISGTDLTAPANLDYTGIAYRVRTFDGDLSALRFDGEYQFVGDYLETLAAGVRFARRRATNAPGLIFADAAVSGISAADMPGFVMANPYDDFFPGETSIRSFLTGNLALARDAAALRSAFGITAPIPASGDPLGVWEIDERTVASYVMARFAAGNLPLTGNAGLRVIQTREQVTGAQSVPSTGEIEAIGIDESYVDTLPSVNLRFEPKKGLVLRAAASKTLTRPDFNQLSPSLTLLRNSIQPELNQGSAGNPTLEPVRADNFDLAVERYFNKHTAIYLTGFFKKVDGFVTTVSSPELHDGEIYQVNRPQNSDIAYIRGAEIGYQQFFDFLPGWLRGFGVQANYTFIDSEASNTAAGGTFPLQNLSRHSYNLIGMYERGPLSMRVAYNWRDDYLSGLANIVGIGTLPIYTKAYGWLDASASYRFNDRITLSLEGTNLLRTVRASYYGDETRPQSAWINDRQVSVLMTVRF